MKIKNKLNLGCGKDIRKGYFNVDFEKIKGIDLVYDLNKLPYPFKDNQFEEILMYNILEHLNNPYSVMKELHRVSKNNTIIKILTPHFSSGYCWEDIQHKRGFAATTFEHENLKNKFKVVKRKILFSKLRFFIKWFANKFPRIYDTNLAYIFPATDIYIELRVIK